MHHLSDFTHYWSPEELDALSIPTDKQERLDLERTAKDTIDGNLAHQASILKKEIQHGQAIEAANRAEAQRQADLAAKSISEKEAFRLSEKAKLEAQQQAVKDKVAHELRVVEDKRQEGIARAEEKANSTGDNVEMAKQLLEKASELL